MKNYEQELDMLRQRIARRREDLSMLDQLYGQEERCRQEVSQRQAEWSKEQRDVERLERLTLSAVLASLRGSKDEDIEREQAEAYQARLHLQEAERQLREVQEEIGVRRRRVEENGACEKEYEAVLREKEKALRQHDPALAERLADLERQEVALTLRRQELAEALQAGQEALFSLEAAQGALNSAGNWGIWDVAGGGLLTDMMKYSCLDEAQSRLEQVRSSLRRYQAELADVARALEVEIRPSGLGSTLDIWFDNVFSDWAVLDQIEPVPAAAVRRPEPDRRRAKRSGGRAETGGRGPFRPAAGAGRAGAPGLRGLVGRPAPADRREKEDGYEALFQAALFFLAGQLRYLR